MRQCVRIWPHTRLHTHHRSCLADGAVGTRHTRMHAGRHLLAWVRSWTAHRVVMRHALRMHAGTVWIARGHHLAGSSVQRNRSVSRRLQTRRRVVQKNGPRIGYRVERVVQGSATEPIAWKSRSESTGWPEAGDGADRRRWDEKDGTGAGAECSAKVHDDFGLVLVGATARYGAMSSRVLSCRIRAANAVE
jgi:hypothetical protein